MKIGRAELWTLFTSAASMLLVAQVVFFSEAKAQEYSTSPAELSKSPAPKGPTPKAPTPKAPSSKLKGKARRSDENASAAAPTLNIAGFLDQVAKGNDAYKAAEMNRKAAENYSDEGSLVLAPTLFASATVGSDGKPSPFSSFGFRYTSVDTDVYQAGVSKLFSNGIRTSFSYLAQDTYYVGLPNASKYYEARPMIEATIPLWRNFWGKETMGNVDAARLGALAKSAVANRDAKAALVDAESAYWRLALSREALKVSEGAVERARATSQWSGRREKLALSDRSENLQSTAQLKSRELDLLTAQDDERAARLTFNSSRGVNSDKVDEQLEVLNADLIARWELPNRTQSRPDIEMMRLQAETAEAAARAAKERSRPTLEVFGAYAFNTPQRGTQGDAIADSWKRDLPTSQYGVRLNMPLDFSEMKKAQEGWAAEARASRTLVGRRLFEQERDWNDVVSRFQMAKERVRLYEDLENSQKEKLEYERTRQKSGRSTLKQVIDFETDFQNTQFARIRSLADILNLNTQMKLYGVAYAPSASGADAAVSNE